MTDRALAELIRHYNWVLQGKNPRDERKQPLFALSYMDSQVHGDVLRFEVAAVEPSRVGFRLAYRVTRPSDGKDIALVETGMVSFDYEQRRIAPLPAAIRAVCREVNGT